MTTFEVLISKTGENEWAHKTLDSIQEQTYPAHRVTTFNEENLGQGLWKLDAHPDSVIVLIREGDWLLDPWVLEYFHKVYSNDYAYFVYTQHISAQTGRLGYSGRVSKRVRTKGTFRKKKWIYGPLHTFRYHLWKGSNGDPQSVLYSVMKEASPRVKYLPGVFYVLNEEVGSENPVYR